LGDVGKALPSAVWMFFGLEVVSVAAEETKNSEKNISVSLKLGVVTTVIICFTVVYFVIASNKTGSLSDSNFPLLYLIKTIQSQDKVLLATFSILGLSTFFASLNGFIYGYSRQIYSLSRAGYLPHFLSKLHPVLQTPYLSIIIPGIFVVIMTYASSYKFLFIFTVFSAVMMYMLVIISFLRIRKYESIFFRQKKSNFPLLIIIFAVIVLFIIFFIIIFNNPVVCLKIFLIWFVLILYYYIWAQNRIQLEAPEESRAISARVKMRIDMK
jgi:ethanolamine permease